MRKLETDRSLLQIAKDHRWTVRDVLSYRTGLSDDNDYMCLEKRISYLEKHILEAKQVGTLYHICSLEAYLKYVLPNDTLSSRGFYTNKIYNSKDFVSFTRSKSYVVPTVDDSHILVRLVVDGDKLSENYKIVPYNDLSDAQFDITKLREFEEAVRGPIKNISKYTKSVQICIANSIVKSDFEMLKKACRINPDIEYFNFIKNSNLDAFTLDGDLFKHRLSQYGIKNGMKLPLFIKSINANEWLSYDLFNGDRSAVITLLDDNPNLANTYFKRYGYPLHFFCSRGNKAWVVAELLDHGADPNKVDRNGNTPLIATINGYAAQQDDIISMLLQNSNIDVNKRGGSKKRSITPLMAAVQRNSITQASTLLMSGADIYLEDDSGKTVFDMTDDKDMLKLLNKYRK